MSRPGLGADDPLARRRADRGTARSTAAVGAPPAPEPDSSAGDPGTGPRAVATPVPPHTRTVIDSTAPVPAPPRRRRGPNRVQMNTRVTIDLESRLRRFVQDHDAAYQDVVEQALDEYLRQRGG